MCENVSYQVDIKQYIFEYDEKCLDNNKIF